MDIWNLKQPKTQQNITFLMLDPFNDANIFETVFDLRTTLYLLNRLLICTIHVYVFFNLSMTEKTLPLLFLWNTFDHRCVEKSTVYGFDMTTAFINNHPFANWCQVNVIVSMKSWRQQIKNYQHLFK